MCRCVYTCINIYICIHVYSNYNWRATGDATDTDGVVVPGREQVAPSSSLLPSSQVLEGP